jgi:3-isopropylmalate/(R)-2-methylmalate dehydratase small subunit
MKDIIKGKAYVLGDNIDTDQMIPAEHLVYSLKDSEERKLYGKYALVGVPEGQQGYPDGNVAFVKKGELTSEFQVIIGGENFGCGSSREHAPFALREAGVTAVIAQSYARIFFRNSVDGGFYPPIESETRLVEEVYTGDELTINILQNILTNETQGKTYPLKSLGDVTAILKAGNVFAYAREQGFLKG